MLSLQVRNINRKALFSFVGAKQMKHPDGVDGAMQCIR
jgi:hypothetical protein